MVPEIGRFADAKTEVEHAAALTKNARERSLFLQRATAYARSEQLRTGSV